MTKLDIKMAKIETDVGHIKDELKKGAENFKEVFKKLDALPDRFDKRYAGKLSERIVYGLVGIILLAFITKLTGTW